MCLHARVSDLELIGIEIQPFYAALCRDNAVLNGANMHVIDGDLTALPADIRNRSFDHVIMNPPYYDRGASTSARDEGRDLALGGDTPLADWITIGAKRLAPKGYLTLIQRIERLPEALTAADAALGSLVVLPLSSRQNRDPGLFLLQARKGGRATFRLKAPLILHEGVKHISDTESYTPYVSEILRSGAPLMID